MMPELPKRIGKCLVCNTKDEFNVCVECDAIVSARKTYRRFFKKKNSIENSYATPFKKEKEIAYYYEQYKKDNTEIGINALTPKELQLFWKVYNEEMKKLRDNFRYMQAVLHYNDETKTFYGDESKWFDELKESYKIKPKVVFDEENETVPF